MATVTGLIKYIATGWKDKSETDDFHGSSLLDSPYLQKNKTSFKSRLIRVVLVAAALVAVVVVSPFAIIHKPISLFINENYDSVTKEIEKHNKKVIAEKNNNLENYETLSANIIKVMFMQLLLSPVYILYGIVFAIFDLTHFMLNYLTKEKNQLIFEDYRPVERKFPINHV